MQHTQSSSIINSTHTSPNLLLGDFYNEEDVNLLATDLNNIVNDIMYTAKVPNNNNNNTFTNDVLLDDHFFSPFSQYTSTSDLNDIPQHISLEYIKLKLKMKEDTLQNSIMNLLPKFSHLKHLIRKLVHITIRYEM